VQAERAESDLRVQCGDSVRVLPPFPHLNSGFHEIEQVTFIGPPNKECHLLVDDEPLPPVAGGSGRAWVWQPGFFAGEVSAELRGPKDVLLGRWRLDVSPDPQKLGGDIFRRMISELLEFDPTLVLGQEPTRSPLGSLGSQQDPLIALARLRAHSEVLLAAFAAVAREPIRAIRPRRRRVPLQAVRRLDRRSLLTSLRQPVLLAVLKNLDWDPVEALRAGMYVDVPEVEQHLDSAANRCLAAMLHALDRRCSDTSERLAALVLREAHSDTVTDLGRRWPTWSIFLARTRSRISSVLHHSPFSDVTRSEITAAGLNAVSAHPLYARAWRYSWLALRTGIRGPERDDLLPLSPTWQIYERWCYMRLLRLLQQRLTGFTWRRLDPTPHSALAGWEGCGEDNTLTQLLLQPRIPSTNGVRSLSFWSVSRERFPDIVLICQRDGKQRFLVLDAKYRVSRNNVLEAMGSAHIYQDSVRFGDRRPAMSLLLVPSTQSINWLEQPEFASTHQVGAVALGESGPPPWFGDILCGLANV
jgi:hypothetical protein